MINISYLSTNPTEKMLSNLTYAPFEMDGQRFASVEGFWQGIKRVYGDRERDQIFQLFGIPAKRAGRLEEPPEFAWYQNQAFPMGSQCHQLLLKRAVAHKLRDNPDIGLLLLATNDDVILHDPKKSNGESFPNSALIPNEVFASFVTELRSEFRQRYVPSLVPIQTYLKNISTHSL